MSVKINSRVNHESFQGIIKRMPDQRRLPFPEDSVSYKLYMKDKGVKNNEEGEDEILLNSSVIKNANGSSYVEYNGAKG